MKGSIEQKYKTVSELDHILLRSGMYIGSTKEEEKQMYIYNNEAKIMELSNVLYVPGLLKIIDEVILVSCSIILALAPKSPRLIP